MVKIWGATRRPWLADNSRRSTALLSASGGRQFTVSIPFRATALCVGDHELGTFFHTSHRKHSERAGVDGACRAGRDLRGCHPME